MTKQTKKTQAKNITPKTGTKTPKLTPEEIEAQQLRFSDDVYSEAVVR